MKGFKPTGYGPSAGFKFPSHFGFTGSTGNVTQVSAHTRVKPVITPKLFADGGFVRQDNPRMKEESGTDGGSPLVRRARSYNQADQESGGKGPLRPGYNKGGKAKKGALAMAFGKKPMMKKADGGPVDEAAKRKATDEAIRRNKLESMEEAGMISNADREFLQRMRAAEKTPPMKKEDGGRVVRRPDNIPAPTFGESVRAVPAGLKMLGKYMVDSVKDKMYNRQRTVEGRNESVDEAASEASSGKKMASRFAKGGKAKKAFGGRMGIGGPQRVMPMQPPTGGRMGIPAMPGRPMMMRSKGGKAKRMGYADGGKMQYTKKGHGPVKRQIKAEDDLAKYSRAWETANGRTDPDFANRMGKMATDSAKKMGYFAKGGAAKKKCM